jgi:hypothetical protein
VAGAFRTLLFLTVATCLVQANIAAAVTPTLAISVPTVSLPTLTFGTVSSTPGTITVTSLATPWELRVNDANASTSPTPGRMRRGGTCSTGESALINPLTVTASNVLNATINRSSYGLETAADPLIAHGSTSASLTVGYQQTLSTSDSLAALCTYSVSVIWSISG